MSRRIRVGILFGGQSAEHEISILSARNVLEELDPSRFEPLLIGIDKSGRWLVQDAQKLLTSARDPRHVRIEEGAPARLPSTFGEGGVSEARAASIPDVIFPVLHGTMGEDGAVQGLLELAGIPYVGAGVLGSAIGMDKDVMKRLLRDAGIAVADFRTLRRAAFDKDAAAACRELAALGFPLFIKPANAGSSVGITKVTDTAGIDRALRHTLWFASQALSVA